MRLSEYIQIGDKLKLARTNAKISQRHMATQLNLTNSTYSNYENGYSEPPVEVLLQFCNIVDMSLDNLLGLKIEYPSCTSVKTFSELISILIDLDRRGMNISSTTTYSQSDNQLIAHLNLDIPNAQLATFIPDWNKVHKDLESGLMDEDDYKYWLEDTLKIFNVAIDDYIHK